jgi:hypothetical protein
MKAEQLLFAAVLIGFATTTSAATHQQQESREADLRARQSEFREMDRDNDGAITRAEWRGTRQAFRGYDLNRDGVLSGDEVWVDRGRGRARGRGPDRERPRFADLDRNGNGVITRDEWRGSIEELRALDADGDGVLVPREYSEGRDVVDTPAYRAGHARGVSDGRQAGREDKTVNGGRWDLEGQRELESADAGYTDGVGPRADYQAGYRAGFRTGYREGFGPR